MSDILYLLVFLLLLAAISVADANIVLAVILVAVAGLLTALANLIRNH